MSIIYNYPQVTPQGSDLLVGTQVYDENNQPIKGNPTRNFTVSSVGNFVNQTYNLYEVPKQKMVHTYRHKWWLLQARTRFFYL